MHSASPFVSFEDIEDKRSNWTLFCAPLAFGIVFLSLIACLYFMAYTTAKLNKNMELMVMIMKSMHVDTRGMCLGMSELIPTNATCT